MKVRRLIDADLAGLQRMAEASGFPYVDPRGPMVESILVVADENNQPVMAVAAERIIQLFGWFDSSMHPAAKVAALRLLHSAMAQELADKGYSEANAFLPPQVCESFGRRLARTFGWCRNWTSYAIRF